MRVEHTRGHRAEMKTPEMAGRGGHGAARAGRAAVRLARPRGGGGGGRVAGGGGGGGGGAGGGGGVRLVAGWAGGMGGGRWGWRTPAPTAGG